MRLLGDHVFIDGLLKFKLEHDLHLSMNDFVTCGHICHKLRWSNLTHPGILY